MTTPTTGQAAVVVRGPRPALRRIAVLRSRGLIPSNVVPVQMTWPMVPAPVYAMPQRWPLPTPVQLSPIPPLPTFPTIPTPQQAPSSTDAQIAAELLALGETAAASTLSSSPALNRAMLDTNTPAESIAWATSVLQALGFKTPFGPELLSALQRSGYLRNANGGLISGDGMLGADTLQALRVRLRQRGQDLPFPWESVPGGRWGVFSFRALPGLDPGAVGRPGAPVGYVEITQASPQGIEGFLVATSAPNTPITRLSGSTVPPQVRIPASAMLGSIDAAEGETSVGRALWNRAWWNAQARRV